MDHKLILENSSSVAVDTAKYHFLFEGHKVFNIRLRQICYMDLELKIRVEKIEVAVVMFAVIFLKHDVGRQ